MHHLLHSLALAVTAAAAPAIDAVPGAAVVAAARATLEARTDWPRDASLTALAVPADIVVAGAHHLETRPLARLPVGRRVGVTVDVVSAERRRPITVWFAVERPVRGLRWGLDARAGEPATAGGAVSGVVDAAAVPDAVTAIAALDGQRLVAAVRSGDPVRARDLAPAPAVARGERVRVAVRTGAVSLATWGVARADAALDEHVEIIVDGAEDACQARVVAPGEVRVES